jgi:hypothetical protein
MKIINFRWLIVIVLPLLLICACRTTKVDQSSVATGVWQNNPIIIDGKDSDWIKPLSYIDTKEKLNYSVTNDRDNIYILLSTKNEQEQQKILEGGLTVWINKQGEKNEEGAAGIAFPTGSHSRDAGIMRGRPELYQEKKIMLAEIKDYTLLGFNKNKAVENYDYGKISDEGVDVRIDFNTSGELIYEALVPFSAVFAKSSTHNYGGRNLTVGFYIDGLLPQQGQGRQGRRGGGGGISIGGGLGMGSFGGGGGMGLSIGSGSLGRIGGGGRDQQLYKLSKIWKEVSLAKPPVNRTPVALIR